MSNIFLTYLHFIMFRFEYGYSCNMFFCLLDRLFEMYISVFSFLDLFATYIHTHLVEHVFVNEACHNHEGVLLLNFLLECFLQYSMLFTVLFWEHTCRTRSLNVRNAASVIRTQVD